MILQCTACVVLLLSVPQASTKESMWLLLLALDTTHPSKNQKTAQPQVIHFSSRLPIRDKKHHSSDVIQRMATRSFRAEIYFP